MKKIVPVLILLFAMPMLSSACGPYAGNPGIIVELKENQRADIDLLKSMCDECWYNETELWIVTTKTVGYQDPKNENFGVVVKEKSAKIFDIVNGGGGGGGGETYIIVLYSDSADKAFINELNNLGIQVTQDKNMPYNSRDYHSLTVSWVFQVGGQDYKDYNDEINNIIERYRKEVDAEIETSVEILMDCPESNATGYGTHYETCPIAPENADWKNIVKENLILLRNNNVLTDVTDTDIIEITNAIDTYNKRIVYIENQCPSDNPRSLKNGWNAIYISEFLMKGECSTVSAAKGGCGTALIPIEIFSGSINFANTNIPELKPDTNFLIYAVIILIIAVVAVSYFIKRSS